MNAVRILTVAVVLGTALAAEAKTTNWNGLDGSWDDPSMWDNGVPGAEDSASFPYAASRAPDGYTITVNGDYAVKGLEFADSGSWADNGRGPVTFVGSGRIVTKDKVFFRPIIINGPVIDLSGDTTQQPIAYQDITLEAGAFIYTNAGHSAKIFFNSDGDTPRRPMQTYVRGGVFKVDVYSCYDVPKSILHQTGGSVEIYTFDDTSRYDGTRYQNFPQLDVKGGTFALRPKLTLGGTNDFDFGTATLAGTIEFAGGNALTALTIRDRPHLAISTKLDVSLWKPIVRFPHGVVFESLGDWLLNNLMSMSVRESFTIDTLDQRDGVTPCTVTGWHCGFFMSARNDITVKGGGCVDINAAESLFPHHSLDFDLAMFDAFRILEGTSFRLNSKDRYRHNRIYAEEFELGKDATLTFTVFNTFVVATHSTIGTGAKLVLEVPDAGEGGDYKSNILPALYAGADGDLSGLTVELTGTGAGNYDVKRDTHTVWLRRKTYAPTAGSSKQDWVGGATDANVTSGANWGDGADKTSIHDLSINVGANGGSTINVNLENQSIYRLNTTEASGPVTVTGNPISILSSYYYSSSAGINNNSRYPLTFRNLVRQPSSAVTLAAQAGYEFSNFGGVIEFLGGLDVANQLYVEGLVKVGGTSTIGSLKTSRCTGFASVVDVLNGARLSVTNQPVSTDQYADSYLRVDEGGELRFTGGTGYRSTVTQTHDVNGTLAFEIPFVAVTNHTFAGHGRLEMAQPQVEAENDATLHIAERLKFYPGTWPTVSATQPGRILRLAVDTHATLGALQNWTYGPAADAVPTTDAANRTLTVAKGETLTIDTENPDTHAAHTITFADPLEAGGDVVKKGAGTLAFACCGNTVAGTFRVTEGSLALGGTLASASGWMNVLTAKAIEMDDSTAVGDYRVKLVPGPNDTKTLCLKKRNRFYTIFR